MESKEFDTEEELQKFIKEQTTIYVNSKPYVRVINTESLGDYKKRVGFDKAGDWKPYSDIYAHYVEAVINYRDGYVDNRGGFQWSRNIPDDLVYNGKPAKPLHYIAPGYKIYKTIDNREISIGFGTEPFPYFCRIKKKTPPGVVSSGANLSDDEMRRIMVKKLSLTNSEEEIKRQIKFLIENKWIPVPSEMKTDYIFILFSFGKKVVGMSKGYLLDKGGNVYEIREFGLAAGVAPVGSLKIGAGVYGDIGSNKDKWKKDYKPTSSLTGWSVGISAEALIGGSLSLGQNILGSGKGAISGEVTFVTDAAFSFGVRDTTNLFNIND